MNGIVEVRPNVPLKFSLANYGNRRYRVPKNKTVAHLLPQPSEIIPTTVNILEVLVLRGHSYGDRDHTGTEEVFTTPDKEDPEGPKSTKMSKKEE